MKPDTDPMARLLSNIGDQVEAARLDHETFVLSTIINAAIERVQDDPLVIIPALIRLLSITIVTETPHINWQDTRRDSKRLFGKSLDAARKHWDAAQAANVNQGRLNDV